MPSPFPSTWPSFNSVTVQSKWRLQREASCPVRKKEKGKQTPWLLIALPENWKLRLVACSREQEALLCIFGRGVNVWCCTTPGLCQKQFDTCSSAFLLQVQFWNWVVLASVEECWLSLGLGSSSGLALLSMKVLCVFLSWRKERFSPPPPPPPPKKKKDYLAFDKVSPAGTRKPHMPLCGNEGSLGQTSVCHSPLVQVK